MNEFSLSEHGHEQVHRLSDLASQINAHHRAFEDALQTALERAVQASTLLIEAKSQCPHGTWLSWLEENFEGSVRSAQGYMRVARHYSLEDVKNETVAHLSYGEALRALAEPTSRSLDNSLGEDDEPLNPYRAFTNVFDALTEIRDRELYRPEYETFEDYLRVCPGEMHQFADHVGWLDSPVMKYRAMMLADLWDLWPGVKLHPTGLEIPEGLDYETWKKGVGILAALAESVGGEL